jgi:hypothetical protein
MTKYGSPDLSITVEDSLAAAQDLSAYIDTINELNLEALLQESTAFGDDWVKNLFTGVKRGNPLTVEGFYDDTASTGPDAVLNALGDTREVVITWGGSKTSTFDAIITNYSRKPVRGELTRFSCTLTPTGEVSEDA